MKVALFATQHMPVELSLLMQLAMGRKPSLPVGDLPRPVAEHLKCHPAIVFLGHTEFKKIVGKHQEIKAEHLQYLPYMIKHGTYAHDLNRPNCVTIFHKSDYDGQLYQAGIKATVRGSEVWVQTYHRTELARAKKLLEKRGCLLAGQGLHKL